MEGKAVDEPLVHYGTKRHSGRYPWGSGETPYQHEAWFIAEIENQKANGLVTDKELADFFGMTVREYKLQRSLAKTAVREETRRKAIEMRSKGLGPTEIGKRLGIPEPTVRSYLKPVDDKKQKRIDAAKAILDEHISKGEFIDIGEGVAIGMGMNQNQFELAVRALKNEKGYTEKIIYVPQVNDKDQSTIVKVLCPPGTTRRDILENLDNVHIVNEKFVDQTGVNVYGLKPIKSISSKKVMINYAEDGGKDKDGVIEIRRGAEGLDLGSAHYAQVRIGVDGTHYLKGMAVYADDLPDGVDIRFNTNKHKGTPKLETLKLMGDDPDNPFGAQIKAGGQKGYLNIVSEEGDWHEWSRNIASQMLSKQPVPLAKTQLNLAKAEKNREYEEIMGLTNPTLRRYMLNQFADKCDTASVNLKAAAMPRQATHVILPMTTLKDNEIYAPNYRDGETLVLIRYPHGGTFEIPQLVNRPHNKEGEKVLGSNAKDAVGISAKVAAQLSGADFDGDTVVVIPNNRKGIRVSPAIKSLQEFDTKESYAAGPTTKHIYVKDKKTGKMVKSEKTISVTHKNNEMGRVSNLITDMTLHDAPLEHVVRAVKYSMVIIDAEKHNLDWKKAYKDFDIEGLKKLYQNRGVDDNGKERYGGASTLISRAKSPQRIPKVKKNWKPDEETGEVTYRPHEKQKWYDKEGNEHIRTSKFPSMRLAKDALSLSSGTTMEYTYAEYANYMKSLANKSRKEALATKDIVYSKEAANKYAPEVISLKNKISIAKAHAPVERKAQLLANIQVALKQDELSSDILTDKQKKKIRYQALAQARKSLGGSKPKVDISDREWEAIQAGAFHKSILEDAFRFTDQDILKERAMPRAQKGFTPGQLSLIRARLAAGYTQAEVADMLGVSPSTINRAVKA